MRDLYLTIEFNRHIPISVRTVQFVHASSILYDCADTVGIECALGSVVLWYFVSICWSSSYVSVWLSTCVWNAVHCSGGVDCNKQHKQDLALYYEIFTRVFNEYEDFVGERNFLRSIKSNSTPVLGWKELIEIPYNKACTLYLVWRLAIIDTQSLQCNAVLYTGDIEWFWKCVKKCNTGLIEYFIS